MKACIECKWFKSTEQNEIYNPLQRGISPAECLCPDAASKDPIYGKALCANERSSGIFKNNCGKKGKFWVPKTDSRQ